ncbi:MAG: Nif3-like dinuclear metal center hexameric protein [Actinomycetes bacterium]
MHGSEHEANADTDGQARDVPTLGDVVAVLDTHYPPAWAEPWDAVGLVCGDPEAPVRRVMFAVDPVSETVEEAVDAGADLLVTHHPLLLRPVHGVAATTPKGRLVHRLVRAGIGLHVVHTNGDVADPGVSDALARVLGLDDLRPLVPAPADPLDKVVTFVPPEDTARVLDALATAGAGAIGDYSRCAYLLDGLGTFLPGESAHPTIGERGLVARVPETRLEMVLPRARRAEVVRALREAHPYEEPAYDMYEMAGGPGRRGLGRVGRLARPENLEAFARRTAAALPSTAAGIRVAGDAGQTVEQVAVCGGAGDSLFDAVRAAEVDAYVTADLRHHPASEAVAHGRPALLDAAHWATEWPWLREAAARLADTLAAAGSTVEAVVSRTVTDPWTSALRSPDDQPDHPRSPR